MVSVEPAVVRQITVRSGDELAGTSQPRKPKLARPEKQVVTDRRVRTRLSQDETHGVAGAAASQESIGRTRNNSLRHVKNSKELLRQRSLKRNVVHGIDAHATSKEGRNFTVGNVRTGGLIYLR